MICRGGSCLGGQQLQHGDLATSATTQVKTSHHHTTTSPRHHTTTQELTGLISPTNFLSQAVKVPACHAKA